MMLDCSACIRGRQYVAMDHDPEKPKPIDFAWLCVYPDETHWVEFYGSTPCDFWRAKPCEPSPATMIGFDEVTEFTEEQYRYMISRAHTTRADVSQVEAK